MSPRRTLIVGAVLLLIIGLCAWRIGYHAGGAALADVLQRLPLCKAPGFAT